MVDVKYVSGSQKYDYRAKVVQINHDNQTCYVHYSGWNTRYDEWIKVDRIQRIINQETHSSKRRKVI